MSIFSDTKKRQSPIIKQINTAQQLCNVKAHCVLSKICVTKSLFKESKPIKFMTANITSSTLPNPNPNPNLTSPHLI